MLLLLCSFVVILCSEGILALNFPSRVYSDSVDEYKPDFPLDPAFTKLEGFEIVTSSDKKYQFYGFSKDREFLICFVLF